MSVEFKSQVSSANVNQAFLDKNKDTATAFKLALNRVGSGASIADVQQAINDNLDSIDLHIADYTAHREFDTKANLDTWALTAVNGSFAFATDEKKSYQVIDTLLAEIGGGGGGLNQWVSATSYVIGDVIWLLADYKIYVCTADNSDVTFTPANWQELSSNFLDGYFTITANDNITYTDSLGTELLRKESDVLFIEDFKENAPTTFLTASNAAITVNDATNSTYLSNTIATFTQSSALTTYYVESNPIPVTKKSWLLEPIKIQAMQGIAGGAGTWDLRVFTSTDGIAYTDSNIIVQVGDLKNDKIITQLASDVTHIKLRWTIVNPDDATTLTLGGILITSQAFEVGQITKFNSLTRSGNDNRALTAETESIPFGTGTDSSDGWFYGADGATLTSGNYYEVQFDNSIIKLEGSLAGGDNFNTVDLFVNGVRHRRVGTNDASSVTLRFSFSSKQGEFSKGDKLALSFGVGKTLTNNSVRHWITINEEAYADNVIVDGKIDGVVGSYVIQSESTEIPQGTLLADGSAVSRTVYADLFSVIGTTYGVGDGSTTFNLPDKSSETVGTYFIRYASPTFYASVPTVDARTDGVPYRTNEKMDGKWIWAISLSQTLAEGTELLASGATKLVGIEGSYEFSSTRYFSLPHNDGSTYFFAELNPTTGRIIWTATSTKFVTVTVRFLL